MLRRLHGSSGLITDTLITRLYGCSFPKLDHQTAGDDDQKADPGANRDLFPEYEFAKQNGNQGKRADIDAENLCEAPINRVYDQAVPAQGSGAKQHEDDVVAFYPHPNDRIAAHLKNRRQGERYPRKKLHMVANHSRNRAKGMSETESRGMGETASGRSGLSKRIGRPSESAADRPLGPLRPLAVSPIRPQTSHLAIARNSPTVHQF